MRLKDILWPWGAIGERDFSDSCFRTMSDFNTYHANGWIRQASIAANLRSECLRLHEEVARLNDVLGNISTMAENNQTTKRLEVLYDIQTRTGIEIVRTK